MTSCRLVNSLDQLQKTVLTGCKMDILASIILDAKFKQFVLWVPTNLHEKKVYINRIHFSMAKIPFSKNQQL